MSLPTPYIYHNTNPHTVDPTQEHLLRSLASRSAYFGSNNGLPRGLRALARKSSSRASDSSRDSSATARLATALSLDESAYMHKGCHKRGRLVLEQGVRVMWVLSVDHTVTHTGGYARYDT